MKRNFLGFLLLLITSIGLASTSSQKETKVALFGCTTTTVTLSCGAQYEGCFNGWQDQWHSYVIMNARYCDQSIPPPLDN
jgi:hypothetical protein